MSRFLNLFGTSVSGKIDGPGKGSTRNANSFAGNHPRHLNPTTLYLLRMETLIKIDIGRLEVAAMNLFMEEIEQLSFLSSLTELMLIGD